MLPVTLRRPLDPDEVAAVHALGSLAERAWDAVESGTPLSLARARFVTDVQRRGVPKVGADALADEFALTPQDGGA